MEAHPGWRIDAAGQLFRVLDPGGTQQIMEMGLATLLDRLDRAELRVAGEREQLALLREEFGRWSIVVCDGEWEAVPRERMREDETVTAPCGWLLAYRLHRKDGMR